MQGVFEAQRLDWDSTYEIVLSLMQRHPTIELDDMGLAELNRMILDLPDFADDPELVNDGILRGILRDWYEESAN